MPRASGEDINPKTQAKPGAAPPTGLESFSDSNYIFGSAQKVDLLNFHHDGGLVVLANNFAVHPPSDTSVVPAGGRPSKKIKHVFFILHENKTFDSMLGNLGSQFGPFASTTFNAPDGTPLTDGQYKGISLNTQLKDSTILANCR